MTAHGNGHGSITTWLASYIVAPLLIGASLGICGWVWSLQTSLSAHDSEIDVHDTRLDWHDKSLDKIDAKLDRILERVGGTP